MEVVQGDVGKLLYRLQESHQERIRKDKFLFTDRELDIDKLFVSVHLHYSSFAEFLVRDSILNAYCS